VFKIGIFLNVISQGAITLDEDQQSDYGHMFTKGTEVIVGNFYKF